MSFAHRGVVEGFYGTPWSHADRLWTLERLGRWGMNRYVYAPKNDPLHRERWREPYPDETLREFAELLEAGERAGVTVGFAVSPGLSIRYASAADTEQLAAKLGGFAELGAELLALALDDVPFELHDPADREAFGDLASAHVELAHALRDALGARVRLWLVPTDYLGVEASDYLETLGAALDPRVEIGWTGRTICSPTIERAEAEQRAATLRRPPLVWDNVPVADGPMRPMLHLGPYLGRAPDLADAVSGFLLNPMQHARASAVALHCAAAYMADPRGYDPEAAWREAVREAGEGAPEAFETFARAHRFSALDPGDRDRELETRLGALRAALDADGAVDEALDALNAALRVRELASDAVREGLADRALAAELGPWLEAHARETRRMQVALALLGRVARAEGSALARSVGLLGLEAKLAAGPTPEVASYGPRRVIYPQLTSMHEDRAGFGADPALFRDRCLADDVVRLVEDQALARLGG